MAKIEQYFNSQEELQAFYPSGVPSTVLAIVKNGNNGVLMYTYDNNAPGITGGAEIGGLPEDYSYAVTLSSYTLVGDTSYRPSTVGWYLIGDSGKYYPMTNTQGETWTLSIEDTDWDLPGYFAYYDGETEVAWYTQDNFDYDSLYDVKLDHNSAKYGENRIYIGKAGEIAGELKIGIDTYEGNLVSFIPAN